MKNTTFKRLLVKILAAVTAISCFAAVGCTGKGKTSGTVATDGSTSMAKVIGALGEAFMQANDGIKFTYNPTGFRLRHNRRFGRKVRYRSVEPCAENGRNR